MPQPGETLGGRYRLDDRIAAGGMGEVWRATDIVLGRSVAVKTLQADRAGDPGFQTRFRHEARAMAALHHPGIADVYDYGETGDGADDYIVMARVEGEPLNQRIHERGRLTPAETMSIVAQAGHALQAAHQAGIVHRDVKPGNLIIKPDGTVVLVDFGVARSAESAALTGVAEVVGTALYIAPEQVSKQATGPAADVYALGVVAYHCLAGHPPFTGDNPLGVAMQHVNDPPPDLPADVPPAVRAVVFRALQKNPADRFPSAAAMAAAAEASGGGGGGGGATTALLAGDPVSATGTAVATAYAVGSASARPAYPRSGQTSMMPAYEEPDPSPGYGPGPGPGARRNRPLIIAAAVVLALAIAGGALALANPGNIFGGDPAATTPGGADPSTGVSAPLQQGGNAPATSRTTKRDNGGQGNSTRTPTTRATPSSSPTPTETPTTTPPTTTPATTEPTTADPTDTTGDNEGDGNEDEGDGDGGA